MAVLTFKYGKNLSNSVSFAAGTMYLDTETGEMWFDNPGDESNEHEQVIDLDTFTYKIDSTVTFGS